MPDDLLELLEEGFDELSNLGARPLKVALKTDGQNESEKVPDGETVQIKKRRLWRRESSKAPTEIDSE